MKEKEYLLIYSDKTENSLRENEKRTACALKLIVNEEKEKSSSVQNKLIILISCISVIILILIIFYKKSQTIKKQAMTSLLLEKELVEDLQQKVNESFSEIVQLARDNNPQFWTRFQEVYPEFLGKMLELNPNFKVSELTYCAYIYLGFSTKEIAEFTFKAVKTIENNRYNLRKKLKLSPEQDFSIWLHNFIDRS
ncbi:MAG: LuxR family transcriptional regulator [Chryseobacterium sp.]|uniref:helix-turn-helix transcriptional regulator n=1 Tax=Chryseobacterium sp. TaxID=1871047 RepID=UPI0025BD495F|nr:hypothetical protein [Chryseobacterium sp.]MCJ7932758.1 LuxR family transcriptional regulator [Chryseobacterium sp.]